MKLTYACVMGLATLLPPSALWIHAADTTQTTVTTTTNEPVTSAQAAQMESVKRRQLVFSANQAINDGQRLLSDSKYDEAADRFQYALDALTNGGVSAPMYNRAEAGLAAAKAGQARDFAKDAKFAQAAARLKEAITLQPNNPVYEAQLEDLKKQQEAYEAQVNDPEGTVHNPAVTDEFKDRVAAVQKLLFQGDDYFKTGQFARAEETYSKILILDPYNNTAREKMAHIERYRNRADGFRHEEYEDESLLKVNQDWSEAISPDIVVAPTEHAVVVDHSERAEITRKLQSIILPNVNFDKLDIATVIQFLTAKSKELDPDHVGINFVLRLTSDTPPPTAAPAGAPGAPAAPGAAPAAPVDQNKEIHREVSITLENVPLADILGYIVQQTNLQYTVEDYAVYLRPSIDEGETLTVRTFLAPANFFSGSGLSVAPAASSPDQQSTVASVTRDAQPELASRGIRFPAGATAVFLPGSSKLVVRNTPEQLDLIANLIENLSKESPQIEIESKLVEFNQDSIKGLTFNYTVGAPLPFLNAGTALRDSNSTNSGAPNAGLNPDGIDGLIASNTANNSGIPSAVLPITGASISAGAPNVIQLGAVIDGVGLAAVMEAVNNNAGVSLLSAPNVTTQNGLKASIDIVREFPYPTSFEKPRRAP
jgi:general secretion pathway protein D